MPKKQEDGSSLVEYVFLVALIAAVCIFATFFFGGAVAGRFMAIGSSVAALS